MYGNFKDPASGQTLWGAYNQIVDLIGKDPFNPQTPVSAVPNIAFFDNLLPNLPGIPRRARNTPTQAFYELASSFAPDWVMRLPSASIPLAGGGAAAHGNTTVDPQQDGFVLYQRQLSVAACLGELGLLDLSQLAARLRKNSRNVTFGANYVYSKSNRQRFSARKCRPVLAIRPFRPQRPDRNPLDPRGSRSRSDFDLRHQFQLPIGSPLAFGHGQHFLTNAGRALQAAVGDWQFAGSLRARSGFRSRPATASTSRPTSNSLLREHFWVPSIHTSPGLTRMASQSLRQ